jgi:hypothetical protein
MPLQSLPPQLRFNDLKARGIVRNRMTLRSWINDRGFPPGRMVANTRLWAEPDIAAWLAGLPLDTKQTPRGRVRSRKSRATEPPAPAA